jgi:AAA family ATP:ADP antiporter
LATAQQPSSSANAAFENRIGWISGATLGFIMAGHILLETARDALFLANVSVERLPFVTIAIAVLALFASRSPADRGNRTVLIVLQFLAAGGTLGLWTLLATDVSPWTFYALYVWSGVITSVVVVRFWLLLGNLFTITQGKRLFARITTGGSIGALIGSGFAAFLAPRVGGEGMLLASAGAFALSAIGPYSAGTGRSVDAEPRRGRIRDKPPSLSESVQSVLQDPYACRVAALVMLAGVTLTLGDYLFKSVLTEEVAADQLATWLSRIYLGLNVLSIAMLAIGVTPIVRRLGVDRSLSVLPILVCIAGLGVLAGGALIATVFLKTADGTLRYSLHRTASELLYLPMSSRLRTAVKAAIDIVGQTSAKALASLVILGVVLLPESRSVVATAVVASSALWIFMALRLRHSYLNVFRETLSAGLIETEIDHPELDLDSASSLIAALSDPDERRALAAMRLLTERGHAGLISSLILYHPSPRVVSHALDVFAMTEREDLFGLLDHLIQHEDATVRAASVRASWVGSSDPERLLGLVASECLAIRVSAFAGLVALGEVEPAEYEKVLAEAIDYESFEPRLAAATAARLHYHPVARDALLRIAKADEAEASIEAVRAICGSGDDWYTEHLVGLLGARSIRDAVRKALLERGKPALDVLAKRLADPATPLPVLRHIPRTIARFETPAAAAILIDGLSKVEYGIVRFKLIRGLETLLLARGLAREADSALYATIDQSGLRDEFDRTLVRALDLLETESSMEQVQIAETDHRTLGGDLLVELLEDKRQLATGRLIRLLGLLQPGEDFRAIDEGLHSTVANDRASAEELLETLLPLEVARSIIALVSTTSESSSKNEAGEPKDIEARHVAEYCETLEGLTRDKSGVVRAVALYHAGELGIALSHDRPGESRRDFERDRDDEESLQERALEILRDLTDKGIRGTQPVLSALLAK